MADTAAELPLLSASKLNAAVVSGGRLACNPVIDLTASVSDGGNMVCIWRANDQLVAGHTERNQKADVLKWKEDGQFLAVGWSDGVVRLIGLESSKAVYHIRVCEAGSPAKIDFIAWSRNTMGRESSDRPSSTRLRSHDIFPGEKRNLLDLPHELTFLELETALPKISPLPVSGGSGDDIFVFSTTSSLEFVFRPMRPEDADAVPVMVVGTSDGGIHLSIYDSFVIGTFRYPNLAGGAPPPPGPILQLCGHASHPDLSTHALLLKPQGTNAVSLHLWPMDLTFVHDSAVDISLLASKMTTMQNLLRYLKQAQSHMATEWQSTRELPGRFLNAVKEDLEKMERGPMTIVQALSHTVVTGHVHPPLKEWLTESLNDRNHKRWEKAVVTGLENLRSLVHENFIPALERCGIILSRLFGIARFHESHKNIGFTSSRIGRLMDMVSCLTVVANKILLSVMDELDHFSVFSIWLRLEIDKLSSPNLADELTEKEATMDNGKVLTYIQRYLVSSPLALYFDEVTSEDYTRDEALLGDGGGSLLEILDKHLKRQEAGQPYMKALPRVDFLVNYLTSRANSVFGDIAEAEKRAVRFGPSTELSVGVEIGRQDVHLCSKGKNGETSALAFTAVVPKGDGSRVYLFRTAIPIPSGASGGASTTTAGIGLPTDVAILDFKFLDDSSLLILCSMKSHTGQPARLLRIAYQSTGLSFSAYRQGTAPSVVEIEASDLEKNTNKLCMSFGFPKTAGFTPIQMEVERANKARGDIPNRVCLLGRGNAQYRTYALPEDWEMDMAGLELGGNGDVVMDEGKPMKPM